MWKLVDADEVGAESPIVKSLREKDSLREKVNDVSEKQPEFCISLRLQHWLDPCKYISRMGASRYYEYFYLLDRSKKSYGSRIADKVAEDNCGLLTNTLAFGGRKVDSRLATWIGGAYLLLPSIEVWLDRFGDCDAIATTPSALEEIIHYLFDGNFKLPRILTLLERVGLPPDLFEANDDDDVIEIKEKLGVDQFAAVRLLVPERCLRLVFSLDESKLDSFAVLA